MRDSNTHSCSDSQSSHFSPVTESKSAAVEQLHASIIPLCISHPSLSKMHRKADFSLLIFCSWTASFSWWKTNVQELQAEFEQKSLQTVWITKLISTKQTSVSAAPSSVSRLKQFDKNRLFSTSASSLSPISVSTPGEPNKQLSDKCFADEWMNLRGDSSEITGLNQGFTGRRHTLREKRKL